MLGNIFGSKGQLKITTRFFSSLNKFPKASEYCHSAKHFKDPWTAEVSKSLLDVFETSEANRHELILHDNTGKALSWYPQLKFKVPTTEYDAKTVLSTDTDHVTWIGHSTCLVQTNGIYVVTDPIWSGT